MYLSDDEKREVVRRALDESALPAQELKARLWRAAWDCWWLRREMETPGWVDRLEADGVRCDEERVVLRKQELDRIVHGAFKNGPLAMAQLSPELRLEKLPPKLKQFAETYDYKVHGGAGVLGPTGCGKTLMAVHTADRIARERVGSEMRESHSYGSRVQIHFMPRFGCPVAWFRATEIGNARRNAPLGHGEPEIIIEAMKAPVAFIDDVGWESDRDTALAEIVAHRYDEKRPTVITSGLRTEEIEARYGSAFLRRIVDGEVRGRILSMFAPSKPALVGGAR